MLAAFPMYDPTRIAHVSDAVGGLLWPACHRGRPGDGGVGQRRDPVRCGKRRRGAPRGRRSLRVSSWPFAATGLRWPQLRAHKTRVDVSLRATTHTDLVLRARELGVPVTSIPNASIMSAVGVTGLQLYNFGQTVSMVFFTDTWKPSSFYDRVRENRAIGLHTLVLLDIKVKEQSIDNLARGRRIFEPPRYMTAAQCAQQMLETETERTEGVYGPDSLAVAVARVGAPDQKIAAGTLQQLAHFDMGKPLQSLVLVGSRLHELEGQFLRAFAIDQTVFDDALAQCVQRQ